MPRICGGSCSPAIHLAVTAPSAAGERNQEATGTPL
jgi:hypothetical protein